MDRSKIISVVFLVIILSIGFVAYKFYTDNQILLDETSGLKEENDRLTKENKTLLDRYGKLEKEKQSLEDRWDKVDQEINRWEEESGGWQKKYENALSERDALAKKVKEFQAEQSLSAADKDRPQQVYPEEPKQEEVVSSPPAPSSPVSSPAVSPAQPVASDYWADFVKDKARLEAQLDQLKKELSAANQEVVRLEAVNKDISRKVENMLREKEQLEKEIAFTKRTMDIMSRDLVNERETRKLDSQEVVTLRAANVDLRRDLSLLEKQNLELETTMRAAVDEKKILQGKISGAENLLKKKSIVFEELKDQLNQAVENKTYKSSSFAKSPVNNSPAAATAPAQFAAVELPPIVVTPRSAGQNQKFRGEILAVNWEEKFVVLDLGEAAGMKPGVQLKVMRGDKEMATIEVIETRKEISAADIKEVAQGGIIREGYAVVSK